MFISKYYMNGEFFYEDKLILREVSIFLVFFCCWWIFWYGFMVIVWDDLVYN